MLPKSRGLLVLDVPEERDLIRRRDEFVSVASHELRTPLTSIIAFTELLLDSEERGKVPAEWVQRMRDDAQRLAAIVDDLLDVSRLRAGKVIMRLQQVPVADAVKEAVAMSHASDESHPITISIPQEIPSVLADRGKLGQVLTNLLQNATKYSPNGGAITVSANYQQETRDVVIAVSDRGVGISPEDQKTLFSPFHRVQRPETVGIRGTGLGLYIVKEYVALMNGQVWVESELNNGSTFYVALPIEEPAVEPQA
jgi:signal transduction histidine kinase